MSDIIYTLTVKQLLNGDRIMVNGEIATITEIEYFDEPLVRIHFHTNRWGDSSILTSDEIIVNLAPPDFDSVKFGYGDLGKGN